MFGTFRNRQPVANTILYSNLKTDVWNYMKRFQTKQNNMKLNEVNIY